MVGLVKSVQRQPKPVYVYVTSMNRIIACADRESAKALILLDVQNTRARAVFVENKKRRRYKRKPNGQFDTVDGGGAAEHGTTSEAEKQRKIDSIVIDLKKDNILPSLNPEDLAKAGLAEFAGKKVLLSRRVIVKNQNHHPEVKWKQYEKLIGEALYRPETVLPGNDAEPYFNFISRVGPDKNAIVLLSFKATNEYLEIVNFHWINDRGREQKEGAGKNR